MADEATQNLIKLTVRETIDQLFDVIRQERERDIAVHATMCKVRIWGGALLAGLAMFGAFLGTILSKVALHFLTTGANP